MLECDESKEDIARFCLLSVYETIKGMTKAALDTYGKIPVIYAGGVMSDRFIADKLKAYFGGYFAAPEFSCDNAVGVALYSAVKKGLIL